MKVLIPLQNVEMGDLVAGVNSSAVLVKTIHHVIKAAAHVQMDARLAGLVFNVLPVSSR